MKKSWERKPLAELCEVFADGDWVESKDQSSEGIRLIQTGNVGEGIFRNRLEKARYISETTFKRLRCTEVVEGDCLISRLPDPVGRNCILPDTGERMITAVDCTIVRFKPEQVLPIFFNFYSQSDEYLTTVTKECTGTTRSRISRSNLGLTPIPVPPLAEQQRIVSVLDKAFADLATAQRNAEKNIENGRALFEAHLQSVFTRRGKGWMEKRLSELCDIKHGFAFDGADFSSNVSNQRPIVITPGNFTEDATLSFTDKNTKRFSGSVSEEFRFSVGDLVVVMTDLSSKMKILGKPAFVESLDVLHNQRIGRFVFLSDAIEKRFVYYFLRTDSYLKAIRLSATGTMVKHTAPKRILGNSLPVPSSRVEQQRIVTQLDALAAETQQLTRLYEQKLAALSELKKSLLHQAFAGEL